MPDRCRRVVVLISDSHGALLRIAKHNAMLSIGPANLEALPPRWYSLHGRCMQHMTFGALATLVKSFDVLNSTFCATVLLQRAWDMLALKEEMRRLVQKELQFTYDPPTKADMEHNEHLVQLLDLADDLEQHECPAPASRTPPPMYP